MVKPIYLTLTTFKEGGFSWLNKYVFTSKEESDLTPSTSNKKIQYFIIFIFKESNGAGRGI